MRFISDDNKVFNTIEECKAHEEEVKKGNEKKKQEEYDALKKRYDEILNMIDDWEYDFDDYLDRYNISYGDIKKTDVTSKPDNVKKECNGDCKKDCKKNAVNEKKYDKFDIDLSELLNFLQNYFD